MPRLTFETKGGTWIRRFFLAHTRFACGLFGLVGVIVFRAFCAAWLPLFRLIQPSVAGQTEGGTVFRLVFPAAAVVALVLTRLCLVTSLLAEHAIGFAGDCVYHGSFASRASVAKCRAGRTVRSLGAFFAIFFCIVFLNISAFVAQIPSMCAGFARRFRRLVGSVVVPAGPTNGTGQGFGNLAHLAVVGVVFSDPTGFADGNGRYMSQLQVQLIQIIHTP